MQVFAAMSKQTVDKEMVEHPLIADRLMLLSEIVQRRLPHAGILLFNRGLYVEQARAMRASFPGVRRILFLVGFDKIVQIFDARYYEDRDGDLAELFRLAELLVAPRGTAGLEELNELLQRPENRRFAHSIQSIALNSTYRDISSSEIRQKVAGYERDIPQEVRTFLRETRAYEPPLRGSNGPERDYYRERIKLLVGKPGRDAI
jgi:nicotinamide-nucleotide adenylyltransferase